MTHYNVHIDRKMRLTFGGIEAESPEAAALLARDTPTDEADRIEDCDGENLAALVDVCGDESDAQSVLIDFETERQRQVAPTLRTALQGILDYAENEAYALEKHQDHPEAEDDAKRAWEAVAAARAAIAAAPDACPPRVADDPDIDALLARRRQIAVVWSVDDVLEIRPDLSEAQAWEVLEQARHCHDATLGISWDVLACHADSLFGNAPETDETEEE